MGGGGESSVTPRTPRTPRSRGRKSVDRAEAEDALFKLEKQGLLRDVSRPGLAAARAPPPLGPAPDTDTHLYLLNI